MADVWDHILLLLLTHQTAHVCSLEICTPVLSCADGLYCCRTAPNGCCPEAERLEAGHGAAAAAYRLRGAGPAPRLREGAARASRLDSRLCLRRRDSAPLSRHCLRF
ncbi:uncharacterized protein LOC126262929 [Schistocerca nitens]|uniref:uncharacterized protein LOC126262929 n=1 Tax=Schistocerca nitens TaxID=7011 RepID=UPI002119ADD8|nr:uncharacterized protein LOC126262929 [Schistocerca nitens]